MRRNKNWWLVAFDVPNAPKARVLSTRKLASVENVLQLNVKMEEKTIGKPLSI